MGRRAALCAAAEGAAPRCVGSRRGQGGRGAAVLPPVVLPLMQHSTHRLGKGDEKGMALGCGEGGGSNAQP